MNLWARIRAGWRTHDEHLAEREVMRESAQPDTSIPDVGNVLGSVAEAGNAALYVPPVDHKQEPPPEA
jgi:hypothetical protein